MFHHFDVVTLKKPLPGVDVPLGTTGTIVRVFDWTDPPSYHINFDHPNQREWAFLSEETIAWNLRFPCGSS